MRRGPLPTRAQPHARLEIADDRQVGWRYFRLAVKRANRTGTLVGGQARRRHRMPRLTETQPPKWERNSVSGILAEDCNSRARVCRMASLLSEAGELLLLQKLSLAARRINDRVAIEAAVDDVSCAGDESQVGEAVGRRLWSSAGNRPGTEDLCKHRRVGRLLDGADLCPVDNEASVSAGVLGVDDDQVTGLEILEVSEDLRPSERLVGVPGNRGRANVARDAAAAIPECRMPNRIVNRTFWRIHHIFRCESDCKHGGTDIK